MQRRLDASNWIHTVSNYTLQLRYNVLQTYTSTFTIFSKLNFESQDVSLQESIALAAARALFVTLSAIVNGFAAIEDDTTRGEVPELQMNEQTDLVELWTANYTTPIRSRYRSRERNPQHDLLGHRRWRLWRRRRGRGHLPRQQIFGE